MRKVYKNILVMLVGLSIIAWLFDFVFLIYLVIFLAALSLIPVCARQIDWAWMKIAQTLGWINSKILLTIVYFFILVPLALVSRLFKKDSMNLNWNRKASSYYENRNHTFEKVDLENPW